MNSFLIAAELGLLAQAPKVYPSKGYRLTVFLVTEMCYFSRVSALLQELLFPIPFNHVWM